MKDDIIILPDFDPAPPPPAPPPPPSVPPTPDFDFDGETYVHDRDHDRLAAQMTRVFEVVRDGHWHTLADIASVTGDPEASVSARLRDLRKEKFGGYLVARRYVERGLFEYQLHVPPVHDAVEHRGEADASHQEERPVR